MSDNDPQITYELAPVSFSDRPGATLTYVGNYKRSLAGAEISFDVRSVRRIGFWQSGWLASLLRRPQPVTRNYSGVDWRVTDTGWHVDSNMQGGLERLSELVARHYGIDGLGVYPPED